MLSSDAELKIMALCKGKSISHTLYMLEVTERYVALKSVKLRCQLSGYKLGD